MNQPIRHHWVTDALLKKFTFDADQKRMYKYSKDDPEPKEIGTGNVCVQNDRHTLYYGAAEKDRELLENHFQLIESPGIAAINRLLELKKPDAGDRLWLSLFMSMHWCRSPASLDLNQRLAQVHFDQYFRNLPHNPEDFAKVVLEHCAQVNQTPPENIEAYRKEVLETEQRRIDIPEHFGLTGCENILGVAGVINNMDWQYLVRQNDQAFIISDNPFVLTMQKASNIASPCMDLLHPNAEFCFPISPDMAIVGGWNWRVKNDFMKTPNALTKSINSRQACFSELMVFSQKPDTGIVKITRKYANQKGSLIARTMIAPAYLET